MKKPMKPPPKRIYVSVGCDGDLGVSATKPVAGGWCSCHGQRRSVAYVLAPKPRAKAIT